VGSDDYEYLAFLVMANSRLGNAEKAQAMMPRMRQTVQYAGWEGDEDQQALLREAEALLQAGAEQAKN
jgi:hypothetical protein